MNHIQKGCSSISILKIQQWLNQLNPDLNLTEDGLYGAQTEAALMSFQSHYGLIADGRLTSMTWDKIVLKIKTRKLPDPQSGPSIKPLCFGSKGLDVLKAQQYLNLILPDDPVEVNGIYDAKTQVKVLRFQNKAGLNPDGRIDLATWDKMIEAM